MMDIEKLIKQEEITLTDKISIGKKNLDYYVFWKMEGKKTIWKKGIILLVDNEYTDYSFKEALHEKYNLDIFNITQYDELIKKKIEDSRL